MLSIFPAVAYHFYPNLSLSAAVTQPGQSRLAKLCGSGKGRPVGRPSVYRATFVEGGIKMALMLDKFEVDGWSGEDRSGFWHELLMNFVLLRL